MKKTSSILILLTTIVSMSSTAMGQENNKLPDACKNIVEIKDEKKLIKSRLAADDDYHTYIKAAEKKIDQNQNSIAELKIKKTKNENDPKDYDKQILLLEQKNVDLKNKINDSFMTKTCAWPEFKAEFNQEMSELELAIKNTEKGSKK